MTKTSISSDDWRAEATRLFGNDEMKWAFICPCCKHVATVQDYKDAGAPVTAVAFSCVGRWSGAKREAFLSGGGDGPCNYAGGGLFSISPVRVITEEGKEINVFEYASTG